MPRSQRFTSEATRCTAGKQPPAWVAGRGGALVRAETASGSGRGSAVYSRDGALEQIELGDHNGYFVAARFKLTQERKCVAVSVHGRTDKYRPGGRWLAPYMQSAFDSFAPSLGNFRGDCLVGGDFNLSREMDRAHGTAPDHHGHHGAFFDRLTTNRDLVDCCRHFGAGEKRSLYRKGRAHPDYQIDHLFSNRELARCLRSCQVLDWHLDGLSDHAPVLADFALS